MIQKDTIRGKRGQEPVAGESRRLLTLFSPGLAEALTKALETMAFLCNLPLEDDMAAPQDTVLAQIRFKGPRTGTIQILAGRDFAGLLARHADRRACRREWCIDY